MAGKVCDIVLEGGGVKGIALVGALKELQDAGYDSCRIAGTSAGAIVGGLAAAGMPANEMVSVMQELDYEAFRDKGFLDKLGLPGKTASFVFEKGLYEGEYLRDWLANQLETLGVRTFADLKITEDWAKELPEEQRYKLVVIAADVSRGRLVRFPWDYKDYGLDPDKQLVADAVRASMSIPFFYEPVKLAGSYLVDGGLLSNFPISIFEAGPDQPTIGVKLSAKEDALYETLPVSNPLEYAMAIISTATNAHDTMHIDDPCTQKRTVFVDTFDIKATNFGITKDQQLKLYESGRRYARQFLEGWDYDEYKRVCEKTA